MSNKVGKTPEENVEYTFKYDNGATYTFILFGKNPVGEFIMFEVNHHWKTTMRPSRFAQLYKKNCIKEKRLKITSKKPKEKKPTTTTPQDEGQTIFLYKDEMLKTLESLDTLQKTRIEGVLGYHPDALYCKLRSSKEEKIPEDVAKDYQTVLDVLGA